jgi:hypothetical protein
VEACRLFQDAVRIREKSENGKRLGHPSSVKKRAYDFAISGDHSRRADRLPGRFFGRSSAVRLTDCDLQTASLAATAQASRKAVRQEKEDNTNTYIRLFLDDSPCFLIESS